MSEDTFSQNVDEDVDRTSTASRSSPYDALNQKIIKLLQYDGRMSFRAIAEHLDVSEGTVRNRVTWMKEAKVLTIAAIVDPAVIQYRSNAMLGIKVAPGHTPAEIAEILSKNIEVVYVLWASGRYDLLVEIVVDSDDQMSSLLEQFYKIDNIYSIEIMTGIFMYKNQFLLKREFE